jgi:hypothetical protein
MRSATPKHSTMLLLVGRRDMLRTGMQPTATDRVDAKSALLFRRARFQCKLALGAPCWGTPVAELAAGSGLHSHQMHA